KKIFTTQMNASKNVYDADLKENVAIVIGNEGNGICSELLDDSESLSIPMEGKTESINAAISAAIVMYESLRQRR
ncbi:MAG: TrmH family RNA methyltransferase, partial [Bacillota bacterium]|nr:TrmH family RNA methyltransferase [Bacillota bacterium]